jgi:hypothetical protein
MNTGKKSRAHSGMRSSNRTRAPPPTQPVASAPAAARITSGVTRVSASTKINRSPLEAWAPAFRTAAMRRWATWITRAPASVASLAVWSVEASLTTVISWGSPSASAASRMEPMAPLIRRSSL